jgi:hypothetical protein
MQVTVLAKTPMIPLPFNRGQLHLSATITRAIPMCSPDAGTSLARQTMLIFDVRLNSFTTKIADVHFPLK